jgi:hypothetical protein
LLIQLDEHVIAVKAAELMELHPFLVHSQHVVEKHR